MRLAICLTIRLLACALFGARACTARQCVGPCAGAQSHSPRLYVFDCGTLVYNKPEITTSSARRSRTAIWGVTCYLVVHPKGMLMFDTA